MKNPPTIWTMLAASVLLLAGCAAGMQDGAQTHLSPKQCIDITDIRNHAPITHERNMSELAALEEAGYHPAWGFDIYYPDDLNAAQRLVDGWYQAECPQAQPG
jgi:hypothetical protein